MSEYPAIEAMTQWTTRTDDSSRGEHELIIELTPQGRAEFLPYLEETDTEYRIAIARREIWLMKFEPAAPKSDEQRLTVNYEWKPLNAVGRALPVHNQRQETGQYTFHSTAVFRHAPESWVLLDVTVDPKYYVLIDDRLALAR